jgi:hypothetical protein
MKNIINNKNWNIIFIFLLIIFTFSLINAQTENQNFIKNFLDLFLKNITSTQNNNLNINEKQTFFVNPPYQTNLQNIYDLESLITQIAEKSSKAVVSIVVSKYVPIIERYYSNPFEEFELPPELEPFFKFEFQVPEYRKKVMKNKK